MKDSRSLPGPELARGLMGYVLIIALLCIFPKYGRELAIRLANGIVPLFFFALGGLLLDSTDWIFSRLKRSNQTAEEKE